MSVTPKRREILVPGIGIYGVGVSAAALVRGVRSMFDRAFGGRDLLNIVGIGKILGLRNLDTEDLEALG